MAKISSRHHPSGHCTRVRESHGELESTTDFAILEVEGAPVPGSVTPLELASVASIHVGDPVVAIGHPLARVSFDPIHRSLLT